MLERDGRLGGQSLITLKRRLKCFRTVFHSTKNCMEAGEQKSRAWLSTVLQATGRDVRKTS